LVDLFLQNVYEIFGVLCADCLSLFRFYGDIIGIPYFGSFVKMTTSVPVSESCGDWKRIKCSQDELRLDVTLPSGQSFRYVGNSKHILSKKVYTLVQKSY